MSLELWLQIMTTLSATVASITGLIAILKIKEVHLSLNSRLTEMLRTTKAEGHLLGEKQERDKVTGSP